MPFAEPLRLRSRLLTSINAVRHICEAAHPQWQRRCGRYDAAMIGLHRIIALANDELQAYAGASGPSNAGPSTTPGFGLSSRAKGAAAVGSIALAEVAKADAARLVWAMGDLGHGSEADLWGLAVDQSPAELRASLQRLRPGLLEQSPPWRALAEAADAVEAKAEEASAAAEGRRARAAALAEAEAAEAEAAEAVEPGHGEPDPALLVLRAAVTGLLLLHGIPSAALEPWGGEGQGPEPLACAGVALLRVQLEMRRLFDPDIPLRSSHVWVDSPPPVLIHFLLCHGPTVRPTETSPAARYSAAHMEVAEANLMLYSVPSLRIAELLRALADLPGGSGFPPGSGFRSAADSEHRRAMKKSLAWQVAALQPIFSARLEAHAASLGAAADAAAWPAEAAGAAAAWGQIEATLHKRVVDDSDDDSLGIMASDSDDDSVGIIDYDSSEPESEAQEPWRPVQPAPGSRRCDKRCCLFDCLFWSLPPGPSACASGDSQAPPCNSSSSGGLVRCSEPAVGPAPDPGPGQAQSGCAGAQAGEAQAGPCEPAGTATTDCGGPDAPEPWEAELPWLAWLMGQGMLEAPSMHPRDLYAEALGEAETIVTHVARFWGPSVKRKRQLSPQQLRRSCSKLRRDQARLVGGCVDVRRQYVSQRLWLQTLCAQLLEDRLPLDQYKDAADTLWEELTDQHPDTWRRLLWGSELESDPQAAQVARLALLGLAAYRGSQQTAADLSQLRLSFCAAAGWELLAAAKQQGLTAFAADFACAPASAEAPAAPSAAQEPGAEAGGGSAAGPTSSASGGGAEPRAEAGQAPAYPYEPGPKLHPVASAILVFAVLVSGPDLPAIRRKPDWTCCPRACTSGVPRPEPSSPTSQPPPSPPPPPVPAPGEGAARAASAGAPPQAEAKPGAAAGAVEASQRGLARRLAHTLWTVRDTPSLMAALWLAVAHASYGSGASARRHDDPEFDNAVRECEVHTTALALMAFESLSEEARGRVADRARATAAAAAQAQADGDVEPSVPSSSAAAAADDLMGLELELVDPTAPPVPCYGPGRSDPERLKALLRLGPCTPRMRDEGPAAPGLPPPVPVSIEVEGEAHTTLVLMLLYMLSCWGRNEGYHPNALVFAPEFAARAGHGGAGAGAAAVADEGGAPGGQAAAKAAGRGAQGILLRDIRVGAMPHPLGLHRDAYSWTAMHTLGPRIAPWSCTPKQHRVNLGLLRQALIEKRLGAAYIHGIGVLGISEALLLAVEMREEMLAMGRDCYVLASDVQAENANRLAVEARHDSSKPKSPFLRPGDYAITVGDSLLNEICRRRNIAEAWRQRRTDEVRREVYRAEQRLASSEYSLIKLLEEPDGPVRQGLEIEITILECAPGLRAQPLLPSGGAGGARAASRAVARAAGQVVRRKL
ncbi:hypothetical protein HYH03_007050 [Edaphochlamys debaryana]|uniref:Uncharacterized protein n=1 Tax=Edaphochlamys debaryana TaxID=47281 RepID=A0A835Y1E1_9CHLO|nr:hypothetical protein HYH03_007050 [Edaphochlamys debaryana]|eukprot:KAG2494807.1 hypothetical protein HYH03_007050 [Edaphochlamys debaryana]